MGYCWAFSRAKESTVGYLTSFLRMDTEKTLVNSKKRSCCAYTCVSARQLTPKKKHFFKNAREGSSIMTATVQRQKCNDEMLTSFLEKLWASPHLISIATAKTTCKIWKSTHFLHRNHCRSSDYLHSSNFVIIMALILYFIISIPLSQATVGHDFPPTLLAKLKCKTRFTWLICFTKKWRWCLKTRASQPPRTLVSTSSCIL